MLDRGTTRLRTRLDVDDRSAQRNLCDLGEGARARARERERERERERATPHPTTPPTRPSASQRLRESPWLWLSCLCTGPRQVLTLGNVPEDKRQGWSFPFRIEHTVSLRGGAAAGAELHFATTVRNLVRAPHRTALRCVLAPRLPPPENGVGIRAGRRRRWSHMAVRVGAVAVDHRVCTGQRTL
jgi:hypothetical protein